ncbi:uncharacterized protein METZ01_LOCUS394650 [marine metagenome]|uniref:Uncharacterized protein n=1 Tax=marine metagenome TaxID=408172 RepID=A0A382V5F5_9ZZZZ
MMDVHEFLDKHYRNSHDVERIVELLMKEYSLDAASAIAHIRIFDEDMQTVQVEP